MVEDYSVHMRTGRAYQTGFDSRGKKVFEYRETYKTPSGEFSPQEWRERLRNEIDKTGEIELLESIKNYCSEHCAWLHKEIEIEDYAMEVLAHRSYLYWKEFIPSGQKNWYMRFVFEEECESGT